MSGGDGTGVGPRKQEGGESAEGAVAEGQGDAQGEMTEREGMVGEARGEEVVEKVRR